MFSPLRMPVSFRQNATSGQPHDALYSAALGCIQARYNLFEITVGKFKEYAEFAREAHNRQEQDGRLYYHEEMRPPVVAPVQSC